MGHYFLDILYIPLLLSDPDPNKLRSPNSVYLHGFCSHQATMNCGRCCKWGGRVAGPAGSKCFGRICTQGFRSDPDPSAMVGSVFRKRSDLNPYYKKVGSWIRIFREKKSGPVWIFRIRSLYNRTFLAKYIEQRTNITFILNFT